MMTYYLDFMATALHLSSTGGSHATGESIRDPIVPRGAAGARAAESAVYVTVSRGGARQGGASRGGRLGKHGDWRALGHAATGCEQMAPTVLPRPPRRAGGAPAWR